MKRNIYLISILCFLSACLVKNRKQQLPTPCLTKNGIVSSLDTLNTNTYIKYAPSNHYTNHFPIKYIRVNFHIINNNKKSINFSETEGLIFVKNLLDQANHLLKHNQKMLLPRKNNTAVLPTQFRYELTGSPIDTCDEGIYFHYDDELSQISLENQQDDLESPILYQKYSKQAEQVVNIFLVEPLLDSLKQTKGTVKAKGVGTPHWIKILGSYYFSHHHRSLFTRKAIHKKRTRLDSVKATARFYAPLLNHEMGHLLGLQHTWNVDDGCEDTPRHPNYWNQDFALPNDKRISNNVMDYNHYRNAFTPCQIGKIHYAFEQDCSTQRAKLKPNWCTYDSTANIHIKNMNTVTWSTPKELLGDLIIDKKATLIIKNRVSIPKGGQILVKGNLIIDTGEVTNICGEFWKGIFLVKTAEKKGKLILKNKAIVTRINN